MNRLVLVLSLPPPGSPEKGECGSTTSRDTGAAGQIPRDALRADDPVSTALVPGERLELVPHGEAKVSDRCAVRRCGASDDHSQPERTCEGPMREKYVTITSRIWGGWWDSRQLADPASATYHDTPHARSEFEPEVRSRAGSIPRVRSLAPPTRRTVHRTYMHAHPSHARRCADSNALLRVRRRHVGPEPAGSTCSRKRYCTPRSRARRLARRPFSRSPSRK